MRRLKYMIVERINACKYKVLLCRYSRNKVCHVLGMCASSLGPSLVSRCNSACTTLASIIMRQPASWSVGCRR